MLLVLQLHLHIITVITHLNTWTSSPSSTLTGHQVRSLNFSLCLLLSELAFLPLLGDNKSSPGEGSRGTIASSFYQSAPRLLFNVWHNSPKQSALLSIDCARPFKWVWCMSHKGLCCQCHCPKEEGIAWIRCISLKTSALDVVVGHTVRPLREADKCFCYFTLFTTLPLALFLSV